MYSRLSQQTPQPRQSPSQSRQSRTANSAISALSATSAFLGGNLCSRGNPSRQSRHFFQWQHAITRSRPAKSVSLSDNTIGDLGNIGRICVHGNPSNLSSLCNVGRQSGKFFNLGYINKLILLRPHSRRFQHPCQGRQFRYIRQSLPAISVAILAILACNFGILITPSNPDNLGIFGRQPLQFRQSRPAISSIFFNLVMQSPILGRQFR